MAKEFRIQWMEDEDRKITWPFFGFGIPENGRIETGKVVANDCWSSTDILRMVTVWPPDFRRKALG